MTFTWISTIAAIVTGASESSLASPLSFETGFRAEDWRHGGQGTSAVETHPVPISERMLGTPTAWSAELGWVGVANDSPQTNRGWKTVKGAVVGLAGVAAWMNWT